MYIIHVAPHHRIGLNDELCTMNVNAQPSQSQADSSFSTELVVIVIYKWDLYPIPNVSQCSLVKYTTKCDITFVSSLIQIFKQCQIVFHSSYKKVESQKVSPASGWPAAAGFGKSQRQREELRRRLSCVRKGNTWAAFCCHTFKRRGCLFGNTTQIRD